MNKLIVLALSILLSILIIAATSMVSKIMTNVKLGQRILPIKRSET